MTEPLLVTEKFRVEPRRYESPYGVTERIIAAHPGAAVILPWLDDQHLVMVRNARASVGAVLLELPAGTLEPPEPPERCAHRELAEETGYRAAEMTLRLRFFPSPGITDEEMFLFDARGLTEGGPSLAEDEALVAEVHRFDALVDAAIRGELRDGKTVLALLHVALTRPG